MAKTANISSFAALEDESGITSEREQLLLQTEGSEECRRRDNDGRSTQCQHCGRNTVIPTPKPSRYGKIESFSPWFPQADPKNPQARTWIKKLSRRGTALCIQIFISTAVLLLNILVMIYATAKYGISNDFVDIYQGQCSLVTKYNMLIHIGINVVSTLLLSAGNYCAQLLVAPTRSEVDRAHARGDWLDIGVPSLRNLRKRRIARRRKATWALLMISSVLLHLVWNAAVFAASPYNQYRIAIVTSDYLADAGPWPTQNNQTLHMLRDTSSFSYLNRTQCIERYINFAPGQMDVLVVAANVTMQDHASLADGNTSSSLLFEDNNFDLRDNWIWAQGWLCSAFARPGLPPDTWCTIEYLLPKEAEWTIAEHTWHSDGTVDKSLWVKVDHCLSAGVESLDSLCALRYSPLVLLMVCVLNVAKCAAVYYTAYLHHRSGTDPREEPSLVTIGDAAASFLAEKDSTTEHLPFANREEFAGKCWPKKRSAQSHPGPPLHPTRWLKAASRTRWLVTVALCIALSATATFFLAHDIYAQRHYGIAVGIKSLVAQGLGSPKPYATGLTALIRSISRLAGFFVATLYANIWQVICSAMYLQYNGLLSAMLVANEWNDFIRERKTLRLSSPQGIQRSSYFLSLPYRFAIPLLISSGTLHWLVSQSVFVIQSIGMAYGKKFYRHPEFDTSLVGYSNIGMVYSLILASIMILALVLLGLCNSYRPRPYDKEQETAAQSYTMPLVSTCSAAISAACHRPDEDSDSHLLPVRWGFVGGDYWCFTTSREVCHPELGPRTEPKAPTRISDSKESGPELQIDIGPAFEVLIRSHDDPSPNDAIIVEPGVELNDTSALLRGSSADPEEAGC